MQPYVLTPENDGGFRHVFRIALPMVLSTSSATIMSFVDRMFLGWYSSDSMAASLAAGITVWTFLSMFVGTASYTGTFVAQYYGAGQYDRITHAVWQGVFFAGFAGAVLAIVGANAGLVMGLTGHPPAVIAQETVFFRIILLGAIFPLLSSVFSSFFSGLGRTGIVMVVEICGNVINFGLDYTLIFGHFGAPRLGIKGAAFATLTASICTVLAYAGLLLFGGLGRRYRILKAPRFDRDIFARLLRFGLPNGFGWMVDAAGWTLFVWLIGRLGEVELQAISAAFAINHLAFLPMVGFSAATSILVGQFVGAGRPDGAAKATRSAFTVTILYMTFIAAVFVLLPGPLVHLFGPREHPESFAGVVAVATVLLRFVAFYSIFDSGNLIYSAALKGAGDTRFVMFMTVALSVVVLVLPTYYVVVIHPMGINVAMAIGTAYVIILAFAYYLRFRMGAWKSMRVIETPPPTAQRLGEGPLVEP